MKLVVKQRPAIPLSAGKPALAGELDSEYSPRDSVWKRSLGVLILVFEESPKSLLQGISAIQKAGLFTWGLKHGSHRGPMSPSSTQADRDPFVWGLLQARQSGKPQVLLSQTGALKGQS